MEREGGGGEEEERRRGGEAALGAASVEGEGEGEKSIFRQFRDKRSRLNHEGLLYFRI